MSGWSLYLSSFGLILDIIGALVIAFPDLVLRRFITTPETFTEARFRLFQLGYMIRGQADDEQMDAITEVIESHWEAELMDEPDQILIRQRHGANSANSVAIVYDGDAEGFLGVHIPDEQRISDEKHDWIAQDVGVYEWIGDEIQRIQRRLRWFLTGGAIILLLGFALQIVANFV
jgi:hypothetical protein